MIALICCPFLKHLLNFNIQYVQYVQRMEYNSGRIISKLLDNIMWFIDGNKSFNLSANKSKDHWSTALDSLQMQ